MTTAVHAIAPGRWRRLRVGLPYVLGLGVVVALVLAVNPSQFARAASRFDARYIPAVVALTGLYYVLQGVRWYPLLRAVGVRMRLGDVILLNIAGQSTGLLPGGELTRAVLVSEVEGTEVGATIATITVQELIYTLIIILAAVPAAMMHSFAAIGVVVAFAGIVVITVILTEPHVFQAVLRVFKRLPVVGRFAGEVSELQRDTVHLLRRWDTLTWSAVSVLQAMVAITTFWFVMRAIDPGFLSWPDAAFVYSVPHIAGAASLSPGGLGGFEATAIGMLVAVGAPFNIAVAASILQRAADKGLATLFGIAAFVVVRNRYDLGRSALTGHRQRRRHSSRPPARRRPAPRPAEEPTAQLVARRAERSGVEVAATSPEARRGR